MEGSTDLFLMEDLDDMVIFLGGSLGGIEAGVGVVAAGSEVRGSRPPPAAAAALAANTMSHQPVIAHTFRATRIR